MDKALNVTIASGVCIGAVILAFGYLYSTCLFFARDASDRPERRAALDGYFEGHELYERGEWDAAIAKYETYRACVAEDQEDTSEVEGLIAECHDLAGRPDQALALFDKSLATNPLPHIRLAKANCLRRHRGFDVAIEWLRDQSMKDDERCQVMGEFHRDSGAHAEAIVWFNRLLVERGWPSFAYDRDRGFTALPETLDTSTRNRLASCSYVFIDLARCHYALTRFDEAFAFASMGIAAGHVLTCGDVECRILRAAVFAKRGDLAAARADIDSASALAAAGSYTRHKRRVRAAYRWLEKLEAKARVEETK